MTRSSRPCCGTPGTCSPLSCVLSVSSFLYPLSVLLVTVVSAGACCCLLLLPATAAAAFSGGGGASLGRLYSTLAQL